MTYDTSSPFAMSHDANVRRSACGDRPTGSGSRLSCSTIRSFARPTARTSPAGARCSGCPPAPSRLGTRSRPAHRAAWSPSTSATRRAAPAARPPCARQPRSSTGGRGSCRCPRVTPWISCSSSEASSERAASSVNQRLTSQTGSPAPGRAGSRRLLRAHGSAAATADEAGLKRSDVIGRPDVS
jgi:hypothetical protein